MKHFFLFLLFSLLHASGSFASYKVPAAGDSLAVADSLLQTRLKNKLYHNSTAIEPFKTEINYPLLGGLGAAYMGSGIMLHNYIADKWWRSPEKLYISNDNWSKLANFNKFSHFYSVNLLGHLFSGAYEAAGMQALGSTWYSSLSALAYMSYIEIENGTHKNNGFSFSNYSADILGTAFYIGQYYIPELKSFMPKMSFNPAKRLSGKGKIVFDDYGAQKYWLSVRIKNYLPETVSEFWPSFINIAAGAGLRGNTVPENRAPMELYIALDLDAEKLPLYGPFWQFVKNTLNYFHFPMPGLRVTPDAAFFMFCF